MCPAEVDKYVHDWFGRAAYELRPVFDALIADLKRFTKLFMDETRAPVLDPARARPRPDTSGLLRGMLALGAAGHRRVWPSHMRLVAGVHAERILQGFSGILQVDGYAGYNRLIGPDRIGSDIGLRIVGHMLVASWWRSPGTEQHPLPRTASYGSVNRIGSRPNCVA